MQWEKNVCLKILLGKEMLKGKTEKQHEKGRAEALPLGWGYVVKFPSLL